MKGLEGDIRRYARRVREEYLEMSSLWCLNLLWPTCPSLSCRLSTEIHILPSLHAILSLTFVVINHQLIGNAVQCPKNIPTCPYLVSPTLFFLSYFPPFQEKFCNSPASSTNKPHCPFLTSAQKSQTGKWPSTQTTQSQKMSKTRNQLLLLAKVYEGRSRRTLGRSKSIGKLCRRRGQMRNLFIGYLSASWIHGSGILDCGKYSTD